MKNKLKGYIWMPFEDSDSCIGIVAESSKEAKSLGWAYWGQEYGNDELFTEQRVRWIKDANIEGLPKGIVEVGKEGMKRGLYSYINEDECDNCLMDSDLSADRIYGTQCYCLNCEQELLEKGVIKR